MQYRFLTRWGHYSHTVFWLEKTNFKGLEWPNETGSYPEIGNIYTPIIEIVPLKQLISSNAVLTIVILKPAFTGIKVSTIWLLIPWHLASHSHRRRWLWLFWIKLSFRKMKSNSPFHPSVGKLYANIFYVFYIKIITPKFDMTLCYVLWISNKHNTYLYWQGIYHALLVQIILQIRLQNKIFL